MFYLFPGEKKFIQQNIVSTDLQKKMIFFYSSLIFLIPKVKELITLVTKKVVNTEILRR